jgi:hypothetical protein
LCDRERLGIRGKGGGRAPEHVARQLVEHDGGGEGRLRICQTSLAGKRGDARVQGEKALAQSSIEGVVTLEPLLRRAFLKPETEHVSGPAGADRWRHCRALSMSDARAGSLRMESLCLTSNVAAEA